MSLLIFDKHLIWSGPNAEGGLSFYYYYDAITWIVGGLALAWLTWVLVRRYLRARALRRPARRPRLPRRIIKIKNELSQRLLTQEVAINVHAVGIGLLPRAGEQYCIQVFVNDANQELWAGAGSTVLPDSYEGVPLTLVEMPAASFLSTASASARALEVRDEYPKVREHQDVIIGGISGANTNLTGQSGTIGYFCTRKSRFSRLKEIYLLSNSHVFADLDKAKVDDDDLIMQPSPGEPGSNRPIGALVYFSPLRFECDIDEPNHIDAAIAKLWTTQHKAVLPFIGALKGYVAKKDIKIGEPARKCGRTTGYTEGCIFSIYLDIWVNYDRTRQSAFFKNQLLVEPGPQGEKFVAKGDSGSLLVDADQHALGLIFGGMSELPATTQPLVNPNPTDKLQRVSGYGVANPISDVLERLKIDLLI